MTDPQYSKRSRTSKRESEEKKNNSVSVVVSVVGTQIDNHTLTPTELKCPDTIEKTKTLKTKASAVTENDESCISPNQAPSTPSMTPALLKQRITSNNDDEQIVENITSERLSKIKKSKETGHVTPTRVASHTKYDLVGSKLMDRDSMQTMHVQTAYNLAQ